jgi:hypothetical protein
MKNTLLQNVISNFDLMDKQHFLDWFEENKQWMLENEKLQIIDARLDGVSKSLSVPETYARKKSEEYFERTFNTYR